VLEYYTVKGGKMGEGVEMLVLGRKRGRKIVGVDKFHTLFVSMLLVCWLFPVQYQKVVLTP
jgi:hypothetical protein